MKINLDLYSESPGFHPFQGIACFVFLNKDFSFKITNKRNKPQIRFFERQTIDRKGYREAGN